VGGVGGGGKGGRNRCNAKMSFSLVKII